MTSHLPAVRTPSGKGFRTKSARRRAEQRAQEALRHEQERQRTAASPRRPERREAR